MQKNVVLAIGLTIALYVVYFTWFGPKPPPPPPPGGAPGVAQGTAGVRGGAVSAPGPAARPGSRGVAVTYPDAPDETITNGRVEMTFATRGGALRSASAWACDYHPAGDRAVTGDPGATTAWVEGMPGALAVDLFGGAEEMPDLAASNWKVSRADGAVVAEFDHGDWVITKSMRLSSDPKRPWDGTFVVTFRNVSAKPGSALTLEVVGPVEPRPAVGEADAGVLLAHAGEDGEVELMRAVDVHKQLEENPRLERRPSAGRWGWIAARADFYLGALIPEGDLPADTTVGFRSAMRPDLHGGPPAPSAAATFRLPLTIPAQGADAQFAFRFYAGPNQRSMLSDAASPYHVLHGATVQRNFLISLGPISRLMSWLLAMIASTGMGYGLAVVTLTILVRGALFPLSRKSQISMRLHAQKMQRLKPKLDALKEKYKDSKKQQEATMKLMRQEKVSILPGGCLLAFLQMPIWIALYNVLQTTFEMRHASFLWVQDLTAADHLVHLPFAEGWWVLNGWLNLLPLLMMATWYASAAMQPLPTDPQQASQAKMMRWMPVMMGLFLYSSAAGLALYMTMSAIWSIGETWLIRKLWLNKLEAALK